MDKKRIGLVALGVFVVLAVAGGAAWFGPWRNNEDGPRSGDWADQVARDRAAEAAKRAKLLGAADSFALAWENGTLAKIGYSKGSGDVAGTTALISANLTPGAKTAPAVAITKVDRAVDSGKRAVAVATVTWKLDPTHTWSYETRFRLVQTGGKWLVQWTPSVVEPSLKPGEGLRAERVGSTRGQIVDTTGRALVRAKGSVVVGSPGLPANYARAVLGATGTATAAMASEGRVVVGDITGLSGIELSQNQVLAGSPAVTVQAVSWTPPATSRDLKLFPAVPGRNVTVTLDQRVQALADATMANTATPSALVAIRVSTGDVLAVANGPSRFSSYNRAMIGKYPPGSTFKVATTLGLLVNGLTPDTVVNCPATVTVGKVFRNAEGEVLGAVPFRRNFADSCTPAFVGQSKNITPDQLTFTAALLGYRKLDVGAPVFGGSVPATGDRTEHAANMIGQGKIEASPFAVALASASVANGSSLNPRLVIDGANPNPKPGPALPPAQVAQLRELMRGVVTGGTGSKLAGIPGGDVFGKTGTAEFGTSIPLKTHAWFTGYQGDIAFAVLVEDAGFGGAVAAPLAAYFLTALASGN